MPMVNQGKKYFNNWSWGGSIGADRSMMMPNQPAIVTIAGGNPAGGNQHSVKTGPAPGLTQGQRLAVSS